MQELNRLTIRSIASGSQVYARGVQLFRQGAVRNVQIQRSTGLIRCSVMDNFEYTVTLGESDDTGLTYTCNCADAAKEKGACRHAVAGFIAVLKHNVALHDGEHS